VTNASGELAPLVPDTPPWSVVILGNVLKGRLSQGPWTGGQMPRRPEHERGIVL